MKKLKELREKNNLTCQNMADKLNICKSFYWQIENGNRGLYYGMAKKIATILKTKPDDLFYDEF